MFVKKKNVRKIYSLVLVLFFCVLLAKPLDSLASTLVQPDRSVQEASTSVTGVTYVTYKTYETYGQGTTESPFLITTAQQLMDIKNNLTAYYRLEADIDLQGISWIPLGNTSLPFKGTLDGNDHVIRNLTVTATMG